ncbi:hypothetical protein EG328_005679 [Venturia inaequalis]|uniref:Rhodopsin domain-containing protein n=1 Tax=Venturia inaequalis TaxID=5025 RepID=A0A8H3Z7X1_VENIN|nr:hypothetical protein EG328_005679 [Venturia inaequalis]
MATPTLEQIRSWPPPNFVNPENRVNLLRSIEPSVTILAIIFVCARFYSRTCLRKVLGWDDWVMALASAFSAGITLCHCLSTLYATGYHIWDIPVAHFIPSGKLTYISLVLFAPSASLAKISICMTYLRVFPSQSDRRFAQFGIGFSVIFCVIVTFINIFQCWPIIGYWNPLEHAPKCVDRQALTLATQAVNSISDLLIFLWPARTLWGMRLPAQQKFGLVFVFSIGVIVCIAGVVRLWYLTYYFKNYDLFYNGAMVFILAGVETNLSIICGSLPGCKPLLARFFPTVFGTEHNAASDYSSPRYSKFILPGARTSIRLSRGAPAHLPPASPLHGLERSINESRPKSIDGSILTRTVSVESVPVKLDKRPFPSDYIVLSPLQEVYSPTVTERMVVHGQNLISPQSAVFSDRYSRRSSVVHTTYELGRVSTNGSEAPLWTVPRTPLTPMRSSRNRDPTSPTVSERMEWRGARSWYNEHEDEP